MYFLSMYKIHKYVLLKYAKYTNMYKMKTIDFKYTLMYYYKKRKEVISLPERRKNTYSGSISYSRLWETMERRGIKKQDLKGENFNL